jgi:hypothetical protein
MSPWQYSPKVFVVVADVTALSFVPSDDDATEDS